MAARSRKWPLRIIALGGMNEIGKNCYVIEYEDDMLVVDAGLAFPEEEMLGVDVVIPDFTYLKENRHRLRAVLLTHGHEDHVGGLPYLLREVQVPVYATGLTLGLVRHKLKEYGLELHPDSRVIDPGRWLEIGRFRVLPYLVTHSIPDSVGFGVETPVGTVVYTGDYKFDQTPVDGRPADYAALAELGRRGVLVMLGDSTNADRPGVTPSERSVGAAIAEVIARASGRVLVATFASNVHRIQQVIDASARYGRKVAVLGRSMEQTVQVAADLGYLRGAGGVLVRLEHMRDMPPERCTILTTGSQGEPLSALTRMSTGDHRRFQIEPGDTVVIAATPIPGNEKLVYRTINNLFRLGAQVVYGREAGVHASGHGSQEELKLMLNLLKPRFLVPVHGEYRHMILHRRLAVEMGIPEERVLIGGNGDVFGFDGERGEIISGVPSGTVLVDGLGVGDVGQVVLRDRQQLAQDGILIAVVGVRAGTAEIVVEPDVLPPGFAYIREAEDLIEEVRRRAADAVASRAGEGDVNWTELKSAIRDALAGFLYEKTHRRPMIVPVVLEVEQPAVAAAERDG
ncbi:MAG: ribonuclease J [Bacillota bacterium]|nr:MAG: ribonuclease J [Bacillota bacterium]